MLHIFRHAKREALEPLYLFNTLTGKKELFEAVQDAREVRMYNCGPTVYGRQHIGNLSMFVFTDVLRRTLEYCGFSVKQIINFTDVGHLSSDADDGEDKMTVGLKREGLQPTIENMRALGEKYADLFLKDLRALGVDADGVSFPRASDYIDADIALIRTLDEKGYAYRGTRGLYFDTSRFADYGKLGNIDLKGLKEGARVPDSEKRHPTDFILWKSDEKIGWNSPWGKGFPGWHIECSAMIRSCLGQQIDIHTGGIEHIPVHHNNEIAQSESATGKKPLSRFWLHRAHLQLEGAKIAKSGGNVVYLSDIIERGFHPLALRYLYLTAHYRTPSNFTWEALQASSTALQRLWDIRAAIVEEPGEISKSAKRAFAARVCDDLDTPGALAVLWDTVKAQLAPDALLATLLDMDRVLGLQLSTPPVAPHKVPVEVADYPEIAVLVSERDAARSRKDFALADSLRQKIAEKGFLLEDSPEGPKLLRYTTRQGQN